MKSVIISLPYQNNYLIETNCDAIIKYLSCKYGIYACQIIDCEKMKNSIPIKINKYQDYYTLVTLEGSFSTNDPLHALHNYIFKKTEYDNQVIALHGAAVEYNDEAILFLAPTKGGKTTLTCYLTLNGLGYISEDCILIEKKTLKVHPCLTPISLRKGGLDALFMNGTTPDVITLRGINYERFVFYPQKCINKGLPINSIFFINHNDSINRLIKLNGIDCIERLIKTPISYHRITKEYINQMLRLSKINCYDLLYKDLLFVLSVLKNEKIESQ